MRVKDPNELLKNGTFCALPWIHDFRHLDGKKHLCCIAYGEDLPLNEDFNSEFTHELRKKMLRGEKIPHCKMCYKHEADGMDSYRITQSTEWFKRDAETYEYFANIDENTKPKLFYYDIRYDSKCNLACITCGPQFSTLWKKEMNIPIVEFKLGTEFEEMKQAKKIYLAGGEPLVIDEHIALIKWLADNHPNVELCISTNLVGLKSDVLEAIKKLRNCSLVISVDCWGDSLEYVRYPLKWDKFIRNLDLIKEAGITFFFNSVASVASVFGWEKFNQLDQYYPKDWFIYPLEYPYWMQLQNIPDHLKQKAYDCIAPMKDVSFYVGSSRFKAEVDHCLERVLQPTQHLEKLREELALIDNRRGINHADYLGVDFFKD